MILVPLSDRAFGSLDTHGTVWILENGPTTSTSAGDQGENEREQAAWNLAWWG
jgi:hypothetical protein